MEQPKYQAVQHYILELINKGILAPGDRAPSENKLAAQFGISRQTARHALTVMVSQGVLSRRQGSGTFIAQNTKRVGVCIKYLDTYIFPDIIKGIDERLKELSGTLVLMSSRNDPVLELSSLENLLSYQLDGLIWEPAKSGCRDCTDKTLAYVLNSGIPVVMINGALMCDSVSQVLTSDEEGMIKLIDHLYEQGHRRIAGFFCYDMAQGKRRSDGFKKGLASYGLKLRQEDLLCFDEAQLLSGQDDELQQLLESFVKGINQRGVTAVCCYNDIAARLLIKQADKLQIRVPQDLAVTGFDASERLTESAGSINNLTSVVHPCADLGRTAVNELVRLAESKKPARIEMPVSIVYGKSTMQDVSGK